MQLCKTRLLNSLTLSGFESLKKSIKNKKRSNTEVSLLFWRAARDTGGKPPCVLGDRRIATVPASHFATKNSSQDCFLNVAHPLRVRIPQKFIKNKKRSNTEVSLLFWRAARDTGGKPPCVLGDRRIATVPASHFATKNSSQDCFLNVAHPLRVRIPQKFIKNKKRSNTEVSLLFWRAARDSNP